MFCSYQGCWRTILAGQGYSVWKVGLLKGSFMQKSGSYHMTRGTRSLEYLWNTLYLWFSQNLQFTRRRCLKFNNGWNGVSRLASCRSPIIYFSQAPHGGVCLLTGPAGCGKTATVEALSQDMKCDIIEWVNPTTMTSGTSLLTEQDSHQHDVTYYQPSQTKQFCDFLNRADRYPSLQLEGDSFNEVKAKKIVVIEVMVSGIRQEAVSLATTILECFNMLNTIQWQFFERLFEK